METLLSLTSKRAGDWFKEELRLLGGLDHIVDKGLYTIHTHTHSGTRVKYQHLGGRGGWISEFKTSLFCGACSRIASATQEKSKSHENNNKEKTP